MASDRAQQLDESTEAYAYRMGRDCRDNGPDTTNCHFRLFATPELKNAWERGKADE